MKFSKAEIKQLTPSYIEQLNQEQLTNLCKGVVSDLVEAHDRLNANSSNSSKPPRTDPPWDHPSDKKNKSGNEKDDCLSGDHVEPKGSSSDDQEEPKVLPAKEEGDENPTPKKKPGKQQNAPGFGRTQKLVITGTEIHKPCECKSCAASFDDNVNFIATGGNYVVDIELPKEGEIGFRGSYIKHLYGKTLCSCGFETHTRPNYISAEGEWSIALSEASLVGPMLLAFICFLKYRMHATGSKVQALLRWFGLSLSIGCINKCFREAGRAVSSLEPQILTALRAAGLLHIDETSWYNRKVVRWLWVFCNDGLVYYSIASRGQEVIDSVLEGFKGIVMTDGYRVYRKLTNRIRCWPHLERKGKALEESWDKEATGFGKFVVLTFISLRECVYKLRELPEEQREKLKDLAQAQKRKLLYECMQNLESKHEKTSQMAYEILNDNQAIFRVLEEPELPLSNNRAEQQFRYLAILRQITYGSKSEEGCRALALTASVVDTLLQLGCDAYTYLAKVFDLSRKGNDPPPIPFQS